MTIKLKRGLDLTLPGAPEQVIGPCPELSRVAVLGADYPDLRPALAVSEGERVRLGQALFTDRRHPEIRYTAPAAGRVLAINRGARRRLSSLVIEVDGEEAEAYPAHEPARLASLAPETVRDALLRSGLWTSFRSRPYNSIPPPDRRPGALFVNAMDTNPLAADPSVILAEHSEDFRHGVTAVSRLATGITYVCKSPATPLELPAADGLVIADFEGPHPAGLAGTHMHYLRARSGETERWHVGYQDVIAIGRLVATGRLWRSRIVAVGGPGVRNPRLLRAPAGASLAELVAGQLAAGCRLISGSVLSGRKATPPHDYLGRYHQQVTVVPEYYARSRSVQVRSPLLSALIRKRADIIAPQPTTAVNGWPAGMLPVEDFERVWPLRTPPLPLLRALLVRDTETAVALGCLDLDEEDLALCSFVCPAKHDYGGALRATLREYERSG
jgi:Na+-transporting NADH:ubiquinone oxidoreductase subunit A